MLTASTHIYIFLLLWSTGGNINMSGEFGYGDSYLKASDLLEIQGIVIDNTQSKIGSDFYDVFYQLWRSNSIQTDFSIKISEKPLPSFGTQISVIVNDEIIFQAFMQPRYDEIERLAKNAVYQTINYIRNYEQARKDIQGEDLSGTGIY